MPPQHAKSRRSGAAGKGASGRDWGLLCVVIAVAAAVVCGVFLRVWLLAHMPLNSDEAVVGLMARRFGSGHFNSFYWGQQYGGAESYVAAFMIGIVHGGPAGLNGTSAVLSGVAALLVTIVVREVGGNTRVAALGGGLAWVWSYASIWNSVRENGFRELAICAALGLFWFCVRIHRGRRGWPNTLGLGLCGGLAWWASPEILYFAVPVLVVLVASWDRLGHGRSRGRGERAPGLRRGATWRGPWRVGPVFVALGGAVLGALPWLWTNLSDGFLSLRTGSLPGTPGQGYGYRLSVFFHDMLPIQFGARTVPGGAWGAGSLGVVAFWVIVVLIAGALWRAVRGIRRGRRCIPLLGVALGLCAFPFIYAAIPASGYWADGRYGLYLPILAALALGMALVSVREPASAAATTAAATAIDGAERSGDSARSTRPNSLGRVPIVLGSAMLLAITALTLSTASAGGVMIAPTSSFRGWGNSNAAARSVVTAMVSDHLRFAYGDYWTAYTLDFLGDGRVTVSPSKADVVRTSAMAARVAVSPDPAWLFFSPTRLTAAAVAFSNPETGPGGETEAQFSSQLSALHVGYRVLRLGVLVAVVPSRRVNLPPPLG